MRNLLRKIAVIFTVSKKHLYSYIVLHAMWMLSRVPVRHVRSRARLEVVTTVLILVLNRFSNLAWFSLNSLTRDGRANWLAICCPPPSKL